MKIFIKRDGKIITVDEKTSIRSGDQVSIDGEGDPLNIKIDGADVVLINVAGQTWQRLVGVLDMVDKGELEVFLDGTQWMGSEEEDETEQFASLLDELEVTGAGGEERLAGDLGSSGAKHPGADTGGSSDTGTNYTSSSQSFGFQGSNRNAGGGGASNDIFSSGGVGSGGTPSPLLVSASNGVSVVGSAEPGSTISILLAGSAAATATVIVAADGLWSHTFISPLPHETIVQLQANSPAQGNYGSVSITIDALAEALSVNLENDTGDSANDGITSSSTLVVGNRETGAQVEYLNAAGDWVSSYQAVEGQNTVQLRQVDALGNVSEVREISFVLDRNLLEPAVSLRQDSGLSNSDNLSNEVALVLSSSEQVSVEYRHNDGSWNSTFVPLEGQNTVSIRQTDVAGNQTVSEFTYTLDTLVGIPTVALLNGSGGFSRDGQLSVAGLESGARVEYSEDGLRWGANPPTFSGGGNTVYVRQVDLAGNVSVSSPALNFIIDNTPPSAPTLSVVAGRIISGTAEANSTVELDFTGNGVADRSVVVGSSGSWTITNNTTLTHGSTVIATVRDAAGNASSSSTVVDSQAPIISFSPEVNSSDGAAVTVVMRISGASGEPDLDSLLAAIKTQLLNGDIPGAITGSGGVYQFDVIPNGQGDIAFSAPAGLLVDQAGNISNASAAVSIRYDIEKPIVSLSDVPDAVSAEAFTIILTLTGVETPPTLNDLQSKLNAANDSLEIESISLQSEGVYLLSVLGQSDPVQLIVPENLVSDDAGNYSDGIESKQIEFDNVAPGAITVNNLNGTEAFGQAEANSTLVVDVNGNGSVDYETVVGADGQWRFDFNPALIHNSSVELYAVDSAGNKSPIHSVVVDARIPVTVLTSETNIINNDSFEVTLRVSDWDGDLDNDAIQTALNGSFVNARVTQIIGSDGSYTLTIQPSGGEISLQVPSNLFVDSSNNANLATAAINVVYDIEVPTAEFGAVPALINTGAFEVELNLTGATDLPSIAEITSQLSTSNSGITVDSVIDNGSGNYTVTFSAANNDVALTIPEGLLTDLAGNDSVASNTATITFDGTAPNSPILNASDGNRISGTAEANATIEIDINNNGTIDYTVVADDSGNWAQELTSQLSHDTVVSATATDEAGNKGDAGVVTVDSEIPVAVVTTDTTVINNDSFAATLTVTGWDGTLDDTAIQSALNNSFVNATVTVVSGNAGTYTLSVTPTGGEISLQVPAGLFVDATGNANLESSSTVVNYDIEAPTAEFGAVPTLINAEAFEVELTLTGATDLPGVTDITTALTTANSGITVDSVIDNGSGNYTVTFSAANNDVALTVPEGLLTDQAGNDSVASNTATITFDGTAPNSPTLNASDGNRVSGTAEANATIEIDINNNGTVDYTVIADDSGNWAQELTSQLSHDTVVSATATDEAGNKGEAGVVTVDSEIPVAVVTTDTTVINNNNFAATLTVTAWDGTLSNSAIESALNNIFGNASVIVVGSSAGTYTLNVTPTGGAISLQVPAGLFVDTTGNANLESSATIVNYDIEAPTAEFGAVPALINTGAFEVELNLTGSTDLPSIADIKAALVTANSEVTVGSVVDNGSGNYTVTFSAANNDVALTIPEDLLTDQAGNDSVASNTATITFDGTAPSSPILNASDGNRISGTAEANATIEIDIDNNGSVDYTVVADDSGNWAQELTSQLDHDTVVSATATDEAGNKGEAGLVTVDSEIPVAVLTTDTSVINNDSFTATLTVTAWDGTLDQSAIESALNNSFGNASVIVVGSSAGTYTLSVTPTGGEISLQVPAGLFVDNTGNANLESSATVVSYDIEAPTAEFGAVPALINTEAFEVELNLTGSTDLPSIAEITSQLSSSNSGVTVDSVIDNGSGNYTVTFSAANNDVALTIPEGLLTDQAGNDSVASNTATITFDGAAPNSPILNASDGNRVSGTAEANATIEIDINNNGTVDYTVIADDSGNWAQELTSQLSHDTVVSATATDEAGNKGEAGQVTVDSEIPVAVVTTDTTVINNDSFAATLTVTGWDGTLDDSVIESALNNSFVNASVVVVGGSAGNYTLNITPTGGEISLQVPAGLFVDTTGNANLESSATVVNYDIEAPTAEFGAVPALINTEAFEVELNLTGSTDLPSIADIKAALVTANSAVTVGSVVDNGSGNYTVTFSAANNDVALTIPEGLLTDQAGNDSVASNTATITFDGTAPNSPTLNASDGNRVSGTAEANATIEIDINNNGSVDYTVVADDSGNWAQELTSQLSHDTVVSATATDEAGNKGEAGLVTVDSEIPVAVLTTDTTVINDDSFAATLTVIAWDGTLSNSAIESALNNSFVNASVVVVSDSAGNYTLNITPTGGEISLQVPAGLFVDTTGNANLESSSTVVNYDIEAPTAEFGAVPALINAGAFEVELTLTGATDLPSVTDITTALTTANSGITVDAVIDNGSGNYTVTFSAANNDVALTIPEGLLTDQAGNDSVASNTATITFDGTAPNSPTLNASDGNRVSGTAEANATIEIDINNNGSVDYTVVADDSGNWAQELTSQLSHDTVVSATATDEAGNKGDAGVVTVDSEIPVAVLTTDTTVINDDSFAATLTVTGWDGTLSDSAIESALNNSFANASVIVVGSSAGTYTLNVTPTGGAISLQVPAGLFVDTTGNANLESSATIVNYDIEAPTAEFGAVPALINTGAFEVELTLTGATDLPSVTDITTALTTANSGITVDAVIDNGSGNYTVTFSAANNDVALTIPEGMLTDQAGNDSVASNTATITFDGTAPNSPILNVSDGNRVSGTAEANATIEIDINNNGTVDYTVVADDSGNWAQELTSQLDHDTVVSATATDEAGNKGEAGLVTVDSEIPVAVLTTDTTVINDDRFEVTLTVTGWDGTLDNSDIQSALNSSFTNASVTAINGIAGNYTLTVAPSGDGSISLRVPADLFVDTTNNANLASSVTPVNYDVEAPTAEFGAVPTLINAEAFEVELTLTGATDLPSVAEITSQLSSSNSGITVSSVIDNGSGSYTVTFSAANNDVALTIPEGLLTDQAGNDSVASNTATITFDGTAPNSPTLNASDGNRISGTAEANATIEIDIDNNGTVDYTVVADDSGNWAQELTSQLDHDTVVSATATDDAGNKGEAGLVTVDSEIPVVVLTTDTSVINDDSFAATLTVTAWDGTLSDSAIESALNNSFVNASVVVVSGSAGNYILNITPTGGEISLQVPAGLFVDTTGNANLESSATVVSYDIEAPIAEFGAVPTLINAGAFEVELTLAGATDLPNVADIKAALSTANSGITVDSVIDNGSGNYTVTFSAANNDVALTIPEGLLTDQAGNDSVASNTATITFDGTAPNSPVLDASDGNRVSGTAEADATIEIDIDNNGTIDYTVVADGSGNWAQELTSQLSHDTVVSATATDEAGNKGEAGLVTVDSEIPVAVLTTDTSVINNDSFTATLTVTAWDGTLDQSAIESALNNSFGNASVIVVGSSAGTYTLSVTPTGGEISLQVPAGLFVDNTGNANLESSATVVSYDIEAPTAEFGAVPALINAGAFEVELNLTGATDLPSIAEITSQLSTSNSGNPGVTVDSVIDNGSGNYIVTFSAASSDVALTIPEGLLTDQAGNDSVASNTATITFDGTAPSSPILNASDGNRVSGTAEANATIEIDIDNNGSVDYTVVADDSGNWAQELTSQLSHDTVVSATATDEAGNKGEAGLVTVDSEIPVAVLTTDTSVINNDSFTATLTVTAWDGTLDQSAIESALNNSFGNASVIVVGSSAGTYTLSVTPTGGVISLQVPAGLFVDTTGNANLESSATVVNYDIEAPTAEFGAVPALINTEAFEIELNLTGSTDLPSIADIKAALVTANSAVTVGSVVDNGSGNYTVTFSAANNDVALTVPEGLLTDQAGNDSDASNTATITFDGTAPNSPILYASDGNRVSGTAEANATIEIDINNNGSVDYTVVADGSGNWAQELTSQLNHDTVVSATATDEAGNKGEAGLVTVDSEIPVAVLTTDTSVINNDSFTATLTVTAWDGTLDQSAIDSALNNSFVNATVIVVSGNAGTYTLSVTPTGGAISLQVPAGLFVDTTGNANLESSSTVVNYDIEAPTAEFGAVPALINAGAFEVELNLIGATDLPSIAEIKSQLSGSNPDITVGSVLDNGSGNYTITFSAANDDVVLNVPAGLLTDQAGNDSVDSNTSTIRFDSNVAPVVSFEGPAVLPSNNFELTVKFDQAVTGLAVADFNVTNGTVTGVTPVNDINGYAREYKVIIDPVGGQTVTVNLNDDAVQTVAGTGNAASSYDVAYDGTTVRLEIIEIPESTSGEFTIKVQMLGDLSETGPRGEITSFVARAVDLVNVELIGESNTDDPTIKEFTFKATGDGDVGFRIDGWANGIWFPYIPGNTVEYIAPPFDVEISVDDSAVQLGLDSIVTITFNRPVSGLELDDFNVSPTNATLTNLVKVTDDVYTAVLNASTEDDVTLSLRQGAAVDGNGELSPADQLIVDVLNTPPSASFEGPNILPSTEFDLTVTFDQPVTGLDIDDFTVTNGTVTSVTPVNDSDGYAQEYTITIDPAGGETVGLELKENAAQTAAGIGNSAGSHDVQYDGTTVRLEVIEIPESTGGEFSIMIQVKGDLTASGSYGEVTNYGLAATDLVNVEYLGYNHTSDPTIKEIKFRATGDGDVGFRVYGWTNGRYLPNLEGNSVEYIAPPFEVEVSIDDPAILLNVDSTVNVVFNRAVSGLGLDDFEITSGSATLSDLKEIEPGVYTLSLNAQTSDEVTINLKPGAVVDGNGELSPADQLIVDIRSEIVSPFVDEFNLITPDTTGSPHKIEITFSEDVTGVSQDTFSISQGAISNFVQVDGSTYSVDFVPENYGSAALNVIVNKDNVFDEAGNPMRYSPSWTTFVNGAKVKLLDVEVSDGGFEGVDVRTLTFTFNQAVSGFEAEDLYLQGGRLLSELVTQDGGVTWTAQAQPTLNLTKFYVTLDPNRVDGAQHNKNEYYREIFDISAADENQVLLTVPQIEEGILPFTVVLRFSENTTLETDQITITGSANAQLTGINFVGGIGYQVTITPSQAGTVIIDLEDGLVGNEATALAEIITIVDDTTRPELDLFSFVDRTNQIPESYFDFAHVEFKEVVFGLTVDDFTITNGIITGLVNKGRGYYDLKFEPLGEGEVTIVLREDAATDRSGNGNLAATRTITQDPLGDYYQRAPEVSFESPEILPVGELELKVTFSRAITGLTEGDFIITNGSITDIRSVNGGNEYAHEYIVTINRVEGQDVSVELSENSVQTVAGNGNPAATHTMTHDATTVRLEVIEIPETTSGEFTVKVQALGDLSTSGSFGQVDSYDLSVYGLKNVELISQTTGSDPTIKELVFRATGEGDVEFYFSGEANNDFFPYLGVNTVEYAASAPAAFALRIDPSISDSVEFKGLSADNSQEYNSQENSSEKDKSANAGFIKSEVEGMQSSLLFDLTIAEGYTINPDDFDLSEGGDDTIKLDSEYLVSASQISSGEGILINGGRVIALSQISKAGNSVVSEDGAARPSEYEVQHFTDNKQSATIDHQASIWIDQDVQVAATYRGGALNGKTLYMDGDFSHDQINKEFVDLVEFGEYQKDSFGTLVMGSGIQKLNISDSNAVVNATFNDDSNGNIKNQLVIDGDIGDVVNADGYRAVILGTQKSGYTKLERGGGNSKATVFIDNDVSVIDDSGIVITG